MPLIRKETYIGDVLVKWPEVAVVMLEHGLHCVGCGIGMAESIEEGCKAHGMSGEGIARLLKELNKVAESAEKFKTKKLKASTERKRKLNLKQKKAGGNKKLKKQLEAKF